jgi:chromosomal replication initiator protein
MPGINYNIPSMDTGTWDYGIFWKETIKQIRDSISDQEYMMWFNNIEYEGSREKEIIISVPSSFYRDQVKQRYLGLLEEKLLELSGNPIIVSFNIKKASGGDSAGEKKPAAPPKIQTGPASKSRLPHQQLRKEYTFDNFVIGVNNSFAANAAIAIAKNPGTAYNPCLIYGGVGLGKTHLIQSIGNSAYREFEGFKIVYVTAENFTNEFIQAIRDKNTHKFKNKYRNADVLLIDDIHFLQNKVETQEELFHTFNALYETNKQMVFTCDRPVSELKTLSDRLRSRFERGLNVDLQPPSYETRYAILKKKIETSRTPIPEEVINLICNNVTTNVRDLEAALTKLIAYAELVNKNITIEIAQSQLKDIFSNPRQNNVTIDIIKRVVADYFGLSHNELSGKKRTKAIAFPRQAAMYITREITEYSTTEVGLEFGGRDHTTVMHACQRIENKMKMDPTLEPIVQHLIRAIKEHSTKP